MLLFKQFFIIQNDFILQKYITVEIVLLMFKHHCISEGSIEGAWFVFLLPCLCLVSTSQVVFDRQREDNVIASLIYDS